MMSGAKTVVCIMGVWAVCRAANAAVPDSAANPYQGIVDRNVFGLKPPPPPPDPEANKPPPPKIFLTGITTILGNKRALLKMTPPAKPGEPAKEQFFTLGEGQRDGELEVLEIDEKAGTVKVNEYGTVATLDFEKNGVKVAAASAPGAPPNPAGSAPKPWANPSAPAGMAMPVPTARPMRMPGRSGNSSASSGAYGGAVAPTAYSSSPAITASPVTVSSPGVTFGANQTQAAVQQQQPPLSLEEQSAMMLAQEVANKDKIFPPALPPIAQVLGEQNNSGTGTTPTPPGLPQRPRAPSLPPLPQ